MRTGDEQFIQKGFAFYDAMVAPVVGLQTVAVYEVLRRFVWRSETKGRAQVREAYQNGKLCVRLNQRGICDFTGLSERSVRNEIRRLEAIGWVQTTQPEKGGPLFYQLGHRAENGIEVFYADGDLRNLWRGLQAHARDKGLEGPNELPREERLAFTTQWYSPVETTETNGPSNGGAANGAGPPGTRCRTPRQEMPGVEGTPGTRCRSVIENPSGIEIEKGRESLGADAPGDPNPSSDSPEDGPSRENEIKKGGASPSEKTHTPFAERLAVVDQAVASATAKTKAQTEENRRKREKKQERLANLKGRPKPPRVENPLKHLEGVWRDLMEDHYPSLTIAKWDGKARGQVTQLIEMYGGDVVEKALRYLVENYDTIRKRFWKKGNDGGTPTVGFLLACHESLCREAQLWAEHAEVLEEWAEWRRKNPHDLDAPKDLEKRYRRAREELSALGLGG